MFNHFEWKDVLTMTIIADYIFSNKIWEIILSSEWNTISFFYISVKLNDKFNGPRSILVTQKLGVIYF